MICGVLALDRQERAGADMQRDLVQAGAGALHALGERGGEVQAGGRGGDGAGLLREHGLVRGAVGGLGGAARGDIGRFFYPGAMRTWQQGNSMGNCYCAL